MPPSEKVEPIVWQSCETTGFTIMKYQALPPIRGKIPERSPILYKFRYLIQTNDNTDLLLSPPGVDIGSVPPAAAQRLKQRGGVSVAVGKCLYQIDHRLLIRLFSIKQR
jgi:hypothetical protein